MGVAPRRKHAVSVADLRAILAKIDRTALAGSRDAAVILLGWASALRRSEQAALDMEDVQVNVARL